MSYFYLDVTPPELKLYTDGDVLYITHNAGFFSNASICLFNIVKFFNTFKRLPRIVDRSFQYDSYKINRNDNLIPLYFKSIDDDIIYEKNIEVVIPDYSPQFSNYHNVCFSDLKPFISKFFRISDRVSEIVTEFESKYNLDYDSLCSVYYRGNDKAGETQIATYEDFIKKCKEIKEKDPSIRFLVQTDETDFLESFLEVFNDSIHFEELPHIRKAHTVVHYVLDRNLLPTFGQDFLAATICVSKCKYLVTHSGNCGFWAVMFRGGMNNVHQFLLGEWI